LTHPAKKVKKEKRVFPFARGGKKGCEKIFGGLFKEVSRFKRWNIENKGFC